MLCAWVSHYRNHHGMPSKAVSWNIGDLRVWYQTITLTTGQQTTSSSPTILSMTRACTAVLIHNDVISDLIWTPFEPISGVNNPTCCINIATTNLLTAVYTFFVSNIRERALLSGKICKMLKSLHEYHEYLYLCQKLKLACKNAATEENILKRMIFAMVCLLKETTKRTIT